jgi:hypothetical protein
MNEEIKSEIKYSSYTPAQKKASKLYRQNNKEKINTQRKKYYQHRKENDPTFLEYKRIKAKEYYEKKKLDKVVKPEATPEEHKIEEPVIVVSVKPDEPLPELLKEAITSPLPEEPIKKSKKAKKPKKD